MFFLCFVLLDAPFGLVGELNNRRTPLVVAVEKVSPAVVNIHISETGRPLGNLFRKFGNNLFDPFFQDFFSKNQNNKKSLGSGVLIDKEGHILTNEHSGGAGISNYTVDDNVCFSILLDDKSLKYVVRIISILMQPAKGWWL